VAAEVARAHGPALGVSSGLAEQILRLLSERGETLATAESLTAGLVSSTFADIPGASRVLRGGATAYATDVKLSLLGVSDDVVARFGVVSAACASEMASGARRVFGADWGLSTTGVAGPDPQDGIAAGTVVVGVAGPGGGRTRDLHLAGTRNEVRATAVDQVFALLLEQLNVSQTGSADSHPPIQDQVERPTDVLRVKAFAVVRDVTGSRHAVWRGNDTTTSPVPFHRLLGGHVEFGELAVDAVVREVGEELGVDFLEPRLLGVLESIFVAEGRPGHEVVFVYTGQVEHADVVPPGGGLFHDLDTPIWVEWRRLDGVGEDLPLYPAGLQSLLDGLPDDAAP
jgi:nicotinamide-nucleotide amidase